MTSPAGVWHSCRRLAVGLAVWIAVVTPAMAAEQTSRQDRFVIIVGNNHSIDPSTQDLRYADDDAAMYYKLWRPYAAKVRLLSVLDDATQAQHLGLAAEAALPSRANLASALSATFSEIEARHDAGATRVELVFVFVGHGGVDDEGRGFVHLLDGRFTRAELFGEVISSSPADTTHIIIDACHAVSLIAGRGEHAQAASSHLFEQFLQGNELAGYPNVGVLAATTATRETHEWSRISAGVFSFLVRSGLVGGADVNGDGAIEYSELAAFVSAASAELARVGKQVHSFAWPPVRDRRAVLLDYEAGQGIRLVELSAALRDRIFVETSEGDVWAGIHGAGERPIRLALPVDATVFVRNDQRERRIAAGTGLQYVASLPTTHDHLASRGAIEQAFELGLLSVPFGRLYYAGYVSGRSELIPIELEPRAALAGPKDPSSIQMAGGYFFRRSPLWASQLGHGVFMELSESLSGPFRWTQTVHVGNALAQGSHPDVVDVGLGAGVRYETPRGPLRLHVGLEAGLGAWFVRGIAPSADHTVPTARVYAGARWRMSPHLALTLLGGAAGYRFTIDGSETLRYAPQASFGFTWSPAWP